jgi:hypothetical protein
MTVTRMRERIREAMSDWGVDVLDDDSIREWRNPPSADKVDRMVRLFNEMLAEAQVGNGS